MKHKLLPLLLLLWACMGLRAQPGTLDTIFDPGTGANYYVSDIVLQPDGKILILGGFMIYNGTARNHIARLNADGSLDTSFDPGTGDNSGISAMALQPDGKILIGGYFTSYNDTERNFIARLNADGSLDTGFDPGTGANSPVEAIALQPDGKILIGGYFTSYNGTERSGIARLNSDGSLDTGFNPDTDVYSVVYTIALQPDGKILIGGFFTSYNGTGRTYMARLNADGSLDTGFDPGTGANNWVYFITLQPDGKILIGGVFTSYNGTGRNHITRLNADGSLDMGFDPGTGANYLVEGIALQPDGKILIGGGFTSYNDTGRNYIARLNADGSLDMGFDPGTGANSWVYAIALQPDGKILIGGFLTSYNGTGRNYVARVNGGGVLPSGWSQNPDGVGCAGGNNIAYNPATGVWTATSTNCYYAPPFTSDETGFAQRTLCGDGSITAQVTSIDGSGWAGVMMRESNAPGAKKAQLMTNLINLNRREFRTMTNGAATPQQFSSQNRYWLRIVRAGNQFSLHTSPNGTAWFLVATQNIDMNSCIQVGLAATNNTANSTVTATFANVSFGGGGLTETEPIPFDFSLFPNPTNGELNMDLTQYIGRAARLELYSLEGKLLHLTEIPEVQHLEQLDLSAYQPGMYLIKVKSEGLPVVTKRVVLAKK